MVCCLEQSHDAADTGRCVLSWATWSAHISYDQFKAPQGDRSAQLGHLSAAAGRQLTAAFLDPSSIAVQEPAIGMEKCHLRQPCGSQTVPCYV